MPEQELPPEARTRLVRLVTNPVSTFLIRNISARLDPLLMKATNGAWTSMGRAGPTMVTLITKGRKTGKERLVQLSFVPYEGDALVVASAMGQQKHPAWRYNLEANPHIEMQVQGERYPAVAQMLTDEEKAQGWDVMRTRIPMIHVYETRTDRNIKVFRLRRVEA